MGYKKYYNIFLIICLFMLSILLVKRFIDHDSKIWILINVNDLLFVCAALVFFNLNHLLGMLFMFISFIAYIIVIIFFMPERIFKPTTLIYFVAIFYLIYHEFFRKKKNNKS